MRGECCHPLHTNILKTELRRSQLSLVCGLLRSQREDLDIGADSVTALTIECLSIAKYNETERKVRIMFV